MPFSLPRLLYQLKRMPQLEHLQITEFMGGREETGHIEMPSLTQLIITVMNQQAGEFIERCQSPRHSAGRSCDVSKWPKLVFLVVQQLPPLPLEPC